jgi:hypothetical protein
LPDITIGEDGVCNICKNYESLNGEKRENKLKIMEDLFAQAKKEAWPYQILVAYSGGKDSSYLLYHLKKEYKLNVLAFSVIHPFMRKETQNTIDDITDNIGVDLIKFNPQKSVIKGIIRQGVLDPERYGQRQSVGCSLCGAFHHMIPFVFAAKMSIPLVATGSDPAQSVGYPPLAKSTFKQKLQFSFAKIAAIILRDGFAKKIKIPFLPSNILSDVFGEEFSNSIYQIDSAELLKQGRLPILLSPLSIIDYDFRKKAKEMERVGIIERKKTHSLISNCTLHHFFAYLAYRQYDCHPYEDNFSDALRQGYPTFVEQFAKNGYRSSSPRQDTITFLKEYKKALFLVVNNNHISFCDLFSAIKRNCHFMLEIYGEELLCQATKDMALVHDWANYFNVDLKRI